MIEKKVKSIVIIPLYLLEKTSDKARFVLGEKDVRRKGLSKLTTFDSVLLTDFKEGDYLFMGRMIGEGFEQINYIKMDEKDIKKYFPEARKEPKNRFSRFAGTALFPDFPKKE